MQLELLVVFVVIAVLLGFAVGKIVRDQIEAREQARREEMATFSGRVRASVRTGAQRLTKGASKATRKSAWWMLRRRFRRDEDDAPE